MSKNKLFDDDEDEEEEVAFKTQGEYAKRYDQWREKEELHKLEQKYADKDLDAGATSSSDSEDEEPAEMTEEMEEQFLKTLALLKTKDPRIYDPKYNFFEGEVEGKKGKEEEKIDIISEEKPKPKKEVNSLAAAFADSDDDDDDNGEEIFKVEKKAPEVKPKKQEKLKDFLTGKEAHLDPNAEKELAPLRALWSDPNLNEGEAFLRDYILNKRYAEPSSSAPENLLDDAALEQDEEIVEEQGKFERAYNFRFEEPDQEYLKRYPRTMSSIRPKDDRRAKKRDETRTRKEEEKKRKMEEIARLKALKLKEIQEKIARIKEVTGNEELAFKDEDIEGDFDPEAHDRRMRAIFDEQYYGDADDEKPVFPDLDEELEIENWENFEDEGEVQGQSAEGPHCEDEDFNMDADYDPKRARTTLMEEIKETLGTKRRNRKKKSKLASLLASEKPKYVPVATEKTYAEHMEEYYKMDCEDVIAGDLPTRFKYRDTVPNDFGLTIEEILLADDKELNRWASLKKTVKYRPENVEKSEVANYRQKAADEGLKKRLLPSLFQDLPEEPEVVVPVEKSKKKKKKKKAKATTPAEAAAVTGVDSADETEPNGVEDCDQNQEAEPEIIKEARSSKKNKKKHKKSAENTDLSNRNEDVSSSIADVESIAVETKKETRSSVDVSLNTSSTEVKKKARRKKKKPQDGFIVENVQAANPSKNVAQQNGSNNVASKKKSGNNQSKEASENKVNLKRKIDATDTNNTDNPKKKKKKNKPNKNNLQNGIGKKDFKNNKFNKNDNSKKNKDKNNSDNPLNKLTDERLKAYGLNPKKYRSFLKYKKF